MNIMNKSSIPPGTTAPHCINHKPSCTWDGGEARYLYQNLQQLNDVTDRTWALGGGVGKKGVKN